MSDSILSADPQQLTAARTALHWAVQPLAAAGFALAESQLDDSHSNLLWVDGQFVGRKLLSYHRLSFDIVNFSMSLHSNSDNAVLEEMSLVGRKLDDINKTLVRWLVAVGYKLDDTLPPLPYIADLPAHPVTTGAPFAPQPPPQLQALRAWYQLADGSLKSFAAKTPGTSEVRIWPHHFDMATLLTLDPNEKDSEKARSIGVGFSPGDGSYDQPYIYVTPWPYPKQAPSQALSAGGQWHTKGFTAAVLLGNDIAKSTDAGGTIGAFIDVAVSACRKLLVA